MYNLTTLQQEQLRRVFGTLHPGCQSTLLGIQIGLGTAGAPGQSAPFTPLVLQPGK